MINFEEIINEEINGLYGGKVLKDMKHIIEMYKVYDGDGQVWSIPDGLDYIPTRQVTNYIKKLIKEEARFMFSVTPEITIKAVDEKEEEKAELLQTALESILKESNFSDKIVKAGRDCFIGKRIAGKVVSGDGKTKIIFRPSLEFIYDTDPEDVDVLKKIVFFYGLNDEESKSTQRIWKQTYYMDNGTCFLDEAIYNGFGTKVEVLKETENLGLGSIPAVVIVNDGLTGDLIGESDVEEILESQSQYNKLKSDDYDALRFNMFPERVFKNASKKTIQSASISPGAILDLQSDGLDGSVDYQRAEASFNYNDRLENAINRNKNDMFDLLNVPNVSLEQLKGLMQSGKSMEALYWQLITRGNEKWSNWSPNLKSLVRKALEAHSIFVDKSLNTDFEYTVETKLRYALPEDDQTERENDVLEVNSKLKSKLAYLKKWHGLDDKEAQAELEQIANEEKMFQDAFLGGVNDELNNE